MKKIFEHPGRLSATLWIVFLAVLLVGCGNKPSSEPGDSEILAEVGNRKITVGDFKQSYLLFAHLPTSQRGMPAKSAQLERLIQRKLFAIEAEKRGLDADPRLQAYLDWYRKKTALRELYRREIESKISVSEEEVRREFIRQHTRVRIRHLYATTEQGARKLQERLQAGEAFEKLALEIFRDSTLASSGGDLGFHAPGDLDPAIEETAWNLMQGEISGPVKSKYGWHIVQVLDKKVEPFLTEEDFKREKSALQKKVHERKAARLAAEYVRKIMSPHRPVLKGPAFAKLAAELEKTFAGRETGLQDFSPNLFSGDLQRISAGLEEFRARPLLTFAGGTWTIGDFLDRLQRIPITDRPVYRTPGKLRRDIGILYRDEVLANLAIDRGYDLAPGAKAEWQNRWDDALYNRFLIAILDTITVSEEEMQEYYHSHLDRFTEPAKINVREILVRDSVLADSLAALARAGADLGELARKFTIRTWAQKTGGELGFFDPELMGEVGLRASKARLGELVGPFPISLPDSSRAFSIFRLIGKREKQQIPFHSVREQIGQLLLREKRERTIRHWTMRLTQIYSPKSKKHLLEKIQTLDDTGGAPLFLVPITNF